MKRKTTLTSLDIAVLVREIKEAVIDGRIINIYNLESGDKDTFILKIRNKIGEHIYLLVKPEQRINITKYITELSSSGKVTLLRRFLRGLKINDVKQYEFERIVIINSYSGEGARRIIVELIPRGVLCVTDDKFNILFVNKPLVTKDRELKINRKYIPPPTFPDVLKSNIEDLLRILRETCRTSSNISLGSALIRVLGIPPEVVNEVLPRELRSTKLCEINDNEVIRSLSNIVSFIKNTVSNPKPSLVISEDGSYISFHPFIPKNILCNNCRIINYATFSELVDEYYRHLTAVKLRDAEIKVREKELAKLRRILDEINEEKRRIEERMNELQSIVDMISKNYPTIEKKILCCVNFIKEKGWSNEIIKACKIHGYQEDKGTISILLDNTVVNLRINESLNKQYFNLIRELKSLEKKIKRLAEKEMEINKKIKEFQHNVTLEKEKEPLLIRLEWYDKYHWVITSNGFLALGGKNAEQNERIVRKFLGDNDIFVHADIHGGSAFVILCRDKEPKQTDILEVATLAASYSKAWKAGLAAIDVFWVRGDQVSKSAPAGEYLGIGAFMIRGKKNYVRNVKLELAIGIEIINNKYARILVGPEELVRSKCKGYVIISPGELSKEKVASEIIKFFRQKEKRLLKLTANYLIEKIPGNSRILKKVWSH